MPIPTCPTDCTSSLPVISVDECNPEINDAQIGKIYLTNIGEPLTDWTDLLEWQGRLDNAALTADAIRTIYVIGSKDKPDSNIKDISLKRKVIGQKSHTVNFKIDETNAINHEAIREFECGGNYLMWYETCGGLLFGGNEGIKVFVEAGMIIPEGADEIITYDGTATWDARFTEERIVSPLA